MTNDIQTARLSAVLHKLLEMQEGSPAPTLAPEILPCLVIESDRPEWAFLSGERLCWGTQSQGAVAAQYGYIQVLNPAGSGVIAVVKDIYLRDPAAFANNWELRRYDTAMTPSGSSSAVRDFRDSSFPACVVGNATSASILGSSGITMPQGHEFKHPIILAPGTGVVARSHVVNVAIAVNFVWTERAVAPSEER